MNTPRSTPGALARFVTNGLDAYATHLPSGENTEPIGSADCTSPNGLAFLSATDSIHSENREFFATENERCLPSGDQDSGTCASPGAGLVKRSTGPVPSARCQKIARSPSRSD